MMRRVWCAVAGVPSEIMGTGSIPTLQRALKTGGGTRDPTDEIESIDSLAAQAIAVARRL